MTQARVQLINPSSFRQFQSIVIGILLFMVTFEVRAEDKTCDSWFAKSGLKPGTNCFLDCASLKVDMQTFNCHDSCSAYCDKSIATDFVFKLSDLYPGLTTTERAIAAEFPVSALKGYFDALEAERTCANNFGQSRTNDESNACRHFLWVGLMTQDIGEDFAKKISDAHENYEGNPFNEKEMDLSNNAFGIKEAKQLRADKRLNQTEIEKQFDKDLRDGKLIVISPRLKKGTK